MNRFTYSLLPVDHILPNPKRVRYHISQKEIMELADSIREYGLLQPIIVGNTPAGLQLIAGERRLKAAKIAGLVEIPAMVGDASSADLLLIYLEENYRRSSLSLLEQAKLITSLISSHNIEDKVVARRMGVTVEQVVKLKRILHLPIIIHDAYIKGDITDQQLLNITEATDPLEAFYQTKT